MSIWVDANGWPIPPTVLLGCLVAEILYFRGWRVLVKAEQAKAARAKTDPVSRALYLANTAGAAGSGVAPTSLVRSLPCFWQVLPPSTYSPAALLGSYDPAPAHTGRHGPTARGRCPAFAVVAGITALGSRPARASSMLKARSLFHRLDIGCDNLVLCGPLIIGMWRATGLRSTILL